MTQRTDIHRPVEMDPQDYEYVYADDNQRPFRLVNVDMDWWRSITNWPAATRDRGTNQCHHCGARIRYFAILKHLPTGEHIAVGETCLDGRFALQSKAEFDRLRKAAQLDRQKMRIKTAAAEFVAALPAGDVKLALTRETNVSETFEMAEDSYPARKIEDYRNKLWNQYGSLFDSGLEFIGKLIEENRERIARNAQIAAERENETEVPAPEGRVTFSGVVIKRAWKDSDYGGAFKLTVKVKDAQGNVWLCWVSEPSKFSCERGDVIEMTATLTRSDSPHFAFGKRPAKFSVLRHEELGEADALADPDTI